MDIVVNTTTIEVNSPPTTEIEVTTQSPFVIEVVTNPVQIKGDSFTSVEYEFNTPSSEWTVNHNKGYYPSVIVLDMFRRVAIAEIEHMSKNQVRILLSSNQIGKVIIN